MSKKKSLFLFLFFFSFAFELNIFLNPLFSQSIDIKSGRTNSLLNINNKIKKKFSSNTTTSLIQANTEIKETIFNNNQKKEAFSKQLRRTEILFFISLPFAYFAGRTFVGDGGATDLLNQDLISSFIASYNKNPLNPNRWNEQRIFYTTYNDPGKPFNPNLFFLWFSSISWAVTISANDFQLNLIINDKNKWKIKFRQNRQDLRQFRLRF